MAFGYLFMAGFIISILLMLVLYSVRQSELGVFFMVLALLTGFWLLMEGASFFVGSTTTIITFQKLKYVSIIYVPPTMLLTAYIFTRGTQSLRPLKVVLIYMIPLLSGISILTNGLPYPFIIDPVVVFENNIPLFSSNRQIGFYIHTVYSYSAILLANIFLLYRSLKLPAIYKNQSFFIFTGSFVTMSINAVFLTGVFGVSLIDSTPISTLFTLMIFCWGVYILPRNKLVTQARDLVIENLTDMVIILDFKRNIIDVNPSAKLFFTDMYEAMEDRKGHIYNYIGVSLEKTIKSLKIDQEAYEAIVSKSDSDITFIKNGSPIYFQLRHQPIIDHKDVQIGEVYTFNDVTKLQNNVNQLLSANEALEVSDQIINDAREAIVITDTNNKIIKVNQSMAHMSGYTMEELIGKTPKMFQSGRHGYIFYRDMWDAIVQNGFWEGEIWDKRKTGEEYPKWMSITVIKNTEGLISRYIGISSDTTRIKKAEEKVHRMAYYDELTGLPNRTLFNDRLTTAMARATRKSKYFALMFIDLDRFKEINDAFGHATGDKLLKQLALRLEKRIRESDTLSRLGGDEFTLILEELNKPEEAEIVAKDIIEAIQKPFNIGVTEISVMISIGISIGPEASAVEEDLLRRADMAMYHAKEMGGNQYFFASNAIEKKKQKQQQLSIALKEANCKKAFELYLQPQIIKTEHGVEVFGAEALIRWPQSNGTMISPFEFIEVAERNGAIHAIGLWVIEEVLRMNKVLRDKGIAINLSLNVSVRQFDHKDFTSKVTQLVEKCQEVPINLSIEITESLFFRELDKAISDLNVLKALGISIALDDFGTGFSSMSYLNRLPIDYLKIDKSFVDEIESGNHRNIAFMILSMAHSLDLKTVAEGVESQYQSDVLFDAGCDIIQGYYYSKPLPFDQFIEYVEQGNNGKLMTNYEPIDSKHLQPLK